MLPGTHQLLGVRNQITNVALKVGTEDVSVVSIGVLLLRRHGYEECRTRCPFSYNVVTAPAPAIDTESTAQHQQVCDVLD